MFSSSKSLETEISEIEIGQSLTPMGDITVPAGYAAPLSVLQSDRQKADQTRLSQVAAKVLQDPLLMMKLCDRVYQLMGEDLRYQRERSRNYGGQIHG
jgi:hypothetical protein